MQLDVLGCSGTYPMPDHPASGFLVTEKGTNILCDAGFGVLGELMRRMPPDRLDAVILSHRHPDHCADFLGLHHALAYGPYTAQGIPVYTAPGMVDVIARFLGATSSHVLFDTFDFREAEPDVPVSVGPIKLTFAPTAHSVPTVCTRFEVDGRSLCYSADTGPGGGFPRLCVGASVVIAEASMSGERGDDHFPQHLTAREAGVIARDAGAEMLILTHLRPSLDREQSIAAARDVFGGEVTAAAPGDKYQI